MKAYQYTDSKFDRLRRQAEELIQSRADLDVGPAADMLELIHELKIHQAELEIQNEELNRAQQELSQLHRQYERLYEFAPCGYVTLDTRGIITHVNLTGVTLLGVPRSTLLHSGLSNYIAKDWQDTYLAARKRAADTGEIQSVELLLKRNNEPSLWVRADIQADRDENHALFQWSVVLVDLTDQRKAEQERLRLEDQLRQAQKMETIGTLAGGVAHDFNNMLTIILGNCELVMAALPQVSPLKKKLEDIHSASLRAKDVVRQLLTFARRSDTQQKPLDIAAVVQASIKLIRSTIPTNIEIRQHLPQETVTVRCNSTQINQLIINLCTNAADAMLPGGGRLTITLERVALDRTGAQLTRPLKPGLHVKLVIQDTGRGMGASTLKHLFEPYFTTKPFGKGSGIGLAVVHGIVAQHRGAIGVESKPGQGTVFTILLPTCQEPGEADGVDEIDLPGGNEAILFVDDELSIVKLAQASLTALGYRVTGITDPRMALETVKADPARFDLVVTDMAMPHMTGEVLSSEILRVRPDLPMILCTGYSEAISEERARQSGISAFLMKPVARAEFALTVRKILDRARTGTRKN